MATDAADLAVPVPTTFASSVVVVCEDTPTLKGPIILEFNATYDSAASSLLFTFSRTDTTGRHADHLQIHPDRIASLTRTVHQPAAPGDQDTPSLLLVRPQFKAKQNLACLHFRLRSLGPTDDRPDSEDKDDDDGDSLSTLAVASVFSAYFPHDTLRKATYHILFNALRPYLDQPAPAEQVGLLPTAPQAGGNTCSDQGTPTASRETTTSPPDYGNDNVGARAGPSQPPYSDGDTVPVSTPSGFGPLDDVNLPAYPDEEDEEEHGNPRKRRNSSEALSSRQEPSKRYRWEPRASRNLDSSPPPLAPLLALEASLVALAERLTSQQQQIAHLKRENEAARVREAALELRVQELEASWPDEDMVRDAVDELTQGLDERVEEVAGECDTLTERVDALDAQHEDLAENVADLDERHQSLDGDHVQLERDVKALSDADRGVVAVDVEAIVAEQWARIQVEWRSRVLRLFRAG